MSLCLNKFFLQIKTHFGVLSKQNIKQDLLYINQKNFDYDYPAKKLFYTYIFEKIGILNFNCDTLAIKLIF